MTAVVRPAPDEPSKPPSWLATSALPIVEVTQFVRVHRTVHDPMFYGPMKGEPPEGRFDSETEYRTLYGADTFDGALIETVIRNPSIRLVDPRRLHERSCTLVECSRPLRLVKCMDDGLQAIGADNSISAGMYQHSRDWALALWAHAEQADGLVYRSRHDTSRLCYAVWCRTQGLLSAASTMPLQGMWPEALRALKQYRKQLMVSP